MEVRHEQHNAVPPLQRSMCRRSKQVSPMPKVDSQARLLSLQRVDSDSYYTGFLCPLARRTEDPAVTAALSRHRIEKWC